MIKISSEHKEKINKVLLNPAGNRLEELLKTLTPILQWYHPLEPIKIGSRLLESLFAGWLGRPEESIVHYWTICRLIQDYGYPPDHIDHEVRCGGLGSQALELGDTRADIVVYSHKNRGPDTALIVVECKKLGGENGERQAASYSRALQSPYYLFTDSDIWSAFETQPYPVDGISISDIPHWVGSKPLKQRLSKRHRLPPITDEDQLRNLIRVCHNEIHSEGVDPAKAFDELVKLFFVKVYDEQEIPDYYRFSILSGESEVETGDNIRALLKEAKQKSKYRELFSEPGDDEFWIQNKSIRKVVETFQGFSFTRSSLIGLDAKGTVYENTVGATFRGELGQYFTPRKIVEFMVDLLEPTREDTVLDPSCGSGGFLIHAMRKIADQIRHQQQNLPEHQKEILIRDTVVQNIRGTDISPRMVRAARMNMIMHGDGWSGIVRCHGLDIQSHQAFQGNNSQFSLILSNPPFAGYEMNESLLARFETSKNERGKVRGVHRAIVFVEQIIDLLTENGRAGIVLPRSIFENESYGFKKIRSLIFDRCEILALIGLPKTAFHHTDCGILGDLLFIKKVSQPKQEYGVFVGWAEEVGYNTLGHNIEENDLPAILNKYLKRTDRISVSRLRSEDNLNPWHYHPDAESLRYEIDKNISKTVSLSNLVSIYQNTISRRALNQTPDRIVRYLEVRDVDPITGAFTPTERRAKELPSRAKYELDGEELILLPNARNSLESNRAIVKVASNTKGLIMTNRFLPLCPLVNVDYLVMILNSPFVRRQLIAACRGAGSPDLNATKLNEIMVPVPKSTDLSTIDSFMEPIVDLHARKKELESEIADLSETISQKIQSLIET